MSSDLFIGLQVLNPTLKQLEQYIVDNNIPRCADDDQQLHVTIYFGRAPKRQIDAAVFSTHSAKVTDIHVFDDDGKKCLVLLLDAPTVIRRHKYLLRTFGLTHSHPKFIPHITIGYDIGNFEWWKLPMFNHKINLGHEEVRAGNSRTWKKPMNSPWALIRQLLNIMKRNNK